MAMHKNIDLGTSIILLILTADFLFLWVPNNINANLDPTC